MRVEVEGIDALRALTASLPRDVAEATADHLHRGEVLPLVADMRARAHRYGRMGARAASTLTVSVTPQGADIGAGGGGSDLGAVLFAGSEYGAVGKRRTTYARRARGASSATAVTRRSTRMFMPHLGRRGYWFWPAMRTDLRGIIGRTSQVVQGVIDRG